MPRAVSWKSQTCHPEPCNKQGSFLAFVYLSRACILCLSKCYLCTSMCRVHASGCLEFPLSCARFVFGLSSGALDICFVTRTFGPQIHSSACRWQLQLRAVPRIRGTFRECKAGRSGSAGAFFGRVEGPFWVGLKGNPRETHFWRGSLTNPGHLSDRCTEGTWSVFSVSCLLAYRLYTGFSASGFSVSMNLSVACS